MVRLPYSYSVPSPRKLFKNFSTANKTHQTQNSFKYRMVRVTEQLPVILPSTESIQFILSLLNCFQRSSVINISETEQCYCRGMCSGTKATPLLGSENRGGVILSVSNINVSAAFSLLNKVCNSIYFIPNSHPT